MAEKFDSHGEVKAKAQAGAQTEQLSLPKEQLFYALPTGLKTVGRPVLFLGKHFKHEAC